MTKKEALEKSLEMWTWLMEQALQGNYYYKSKWFKETGNSFVYSQCYLCQYTYSNDLACSSCPIKEWSKRNSENCCSEGSPYKLWLDGFKLLDVEKYKAIGEKDILQGTIGMVDLLEKALLELKVKELQEEIDNLKRGSKNDQNRSFRKVVKDVKMVERPSI